MSSKKNKPNGGSGPWMIDASLLLAAGIDPKTLLPIKVANHERLNIRDMISVMDEQAAVNRYAWANFPGSLTGQDVERMLYYKFQLAFFYLKQSNNIRSINCGARESDEKSVSANQSEWTFVYKSMIVCPAVVWF